MAHLGTHSLQRLRNALKGEERLCIGVPWRVQLSRWLDRGFVPATNTNGPTRLART